MGLEPSSSPSRHCVLGRLWGLDLDGAPALSVEAVSERMYGNPIAPAVPKLGEVHIVRNLPGFSSCQEFGFHTPKRLWKSLVIHPSQGAALSQSSRGSHPRGCTLPK